MTVSLKRVNGTTVFFANTSTFTKGLGTLNESFLSITNPDRGVNDNLINLRLNGHNLATIRTRGVGSKTTVLTISFGKEIRGLSRASFRITVNGNSARVSGVVDGKQIVPFTIRCSKGRCQSPDAIRFKNGGTLKISIDPQLERAIGRVSNKLVAEIQKFLMTRRPQQTSPCRIACLTAGTACLTACSIFFPPCAIACIAAQAICLAAC